MIENLSQFYKLSKTTEYEKAVRVWNVIDENNRHVLEELIGRDLYSKMVFIQYVLKPSTDDLCEMAFECKENGLSYEIGCYFQKKEYDHIDNVKTDLKKFNSLLKV